MPAYSRPDGVPHPECFDLAVVSVPDQVVDLRRQSQQQRGLLRLLKRLNYNHIVRNEIDLVSEAFTCPDELARMVVELASGFRTFITVRQ